MTTQIVSLDIADDPVSWARLGFTVTGDQIHLGGLRLRLVGPPPPTPTGSNGTRKVVKGRRGIRGWTLDPTPSGAVAGLPSAPRPPTIDPELLPPSATRHRCTATAVDHLVIGTEDLDATTAAFADIGWSARRTHGQPDLGRTLRFFLVPAGDGRLVVEVIRPENADDMGDGQARFWGLAVTVADLDVAARVLGPDLLGRSKAAVQPGRRIATVRSKAAGISVPLAFLSPRP